MNKELKWRKPGKGAHWKAVGAAVMDGKLFLKVRQRKDMVVNPQHYRRLTLKQTMDAENVLLEQDKVIDFPLKPSDLSRYDEVLYE